MGISHVLEHMYFKGTPTRGVGEIARETKASGGYPNAHTIYDHTAYETVLPRSGFVRGLEIQADAWRIGVEEGLRALTRDRLVGFYRNYFRPRNTILVVVGDVSADEALAHVTRLYGHLPDEEVRHPPRASLPCDLSRACAASNTSSMKAGVAPRW